MNPNCFDKHDSVKDYVERFLELEKNQKRTLPLFDSSNIALTISGPNGAVMFLQARAYVTFLIFFTALPF